VEDSLHVFRVILLAFGIVAASTSTAFAQYAELTGRILDSSGATISSAAVSVVSKQKGVTRDTTSNDQGVYLLSALQPDEYLIKVQATGFETASLDRVKLDADKRTVLDITLQVARLFNEDLTVTGDTSRVEVPPSTIDVTPLAVRSVAGAGENIFRVLQTLPGVTFTSDFASRLAVRGGGPDQNLTLMDGVEIHNPYRLFGLTSAFNPEVVENFELTAGAFNAKYGDRLSSILIVDNRAGTRQSALTGTAAMSLTDGNVVAEGRLPGTTNGSWLVTGRRTYYDLIAERFVDADLPSFNDLQAKGVWESSKGQRITVFGLQSRERTDAELDAEDLGDDSAPGERIDLEAATNNDLAAITLSTPIGRRASSKTTLSWYRNNERLDFDGDLQNEARRSNRPEDDAVAFSDIVFTRNLGIRDVALRQDTVVQAHPSHLLEFGMDSHWLRTDWTWRITGDRNNDAPNGSSNQIGAGLPSLLDSNRSTYRAGAWFTDKWRMTRRLQLEAGMRFDWSGLADEVIASPRLAAAMDIGAGLRLRVAGGLFTQSPGYEKLLQSDYFVDLSNADSIGLRSEQARHALVSVERQLPGGLVARVEGYYKRFDRLLLGRLETTDETRARLATYDFPGDLAWSVPSAPLITSFPSNHGTGSAYGVDFYVARQATSSSDRLTGWASYTWGKAETNAYGRTFLADYDHPHSLSLVATYRLNRLIDLGATVRVQSGFPYTPALGVRVASIADADDRDGDGNVDELIPLRDSQGMLVWATDYGDLSNLKSARLPLYARVDFRATFKPGWMNRRWQIYVEVMNLLNRENAGSLETELAYNPNSDRPSITTVRSGSLPLLPSLGVRFRF
jgi:hypothetical protein